MKQLAAFIIEDRFFDDFGKICSEHFKHLPKDTDLFVYTSDEHIEKYTEQLKKYKLTATFLPYNKNAETPISIKYIPGLEQLLKDERMKSLFNMIFITKSTCNGIHLQIVWLEYRFTRYDGSRTIFISIILC